MPSTAAIGDAASSAASSGVPLEAGTARSGVPPVGAGGVDAAVRVWVVDDEQRWLGVRPRGPPRATG